MSRSVTEPGFVREMLVVRVGGIVLERSRRKRNGKFDYWELEAKIDTNGAPKSFGGVSGGGVWRVLVDKKAGAGLETSRISAVLFGGVAFYQSAPRKGWRFIRSHGAITTYKVLPKLLKVGLQKISKRRGRLL
jgi:hypothetical protein